MPVLSQTPPVPLSAYLILTCALLLFCIYLRRKVTNVGTGTAMGDPILVAGEEKTPQASSQEPSEGAARIDPQPPPYSSHQKLPGKGDPTIPRTSNPGFSSPAQTPSFTSSPTTYSPPQFPPFPKPTSRSYDSGSMPAHAEIPFQPYQTQAFSSSPPETNPNSSFSVEVELPRRRSYTKTTQVGEVAVQVEVGESWRRHTRVFGGGVCKACEESEEERRRRMSA